MERRLFLRNDVAPSTAFGPNFQVSEGLVRLVCTGLAPGESIGVEVRLSSNTDSFSIWGPFAPCSGQLALTDEITQIRIADAGEYRITTPVTAGPVVVMLQEDEGSLDGKLVFNQDVNPCVGSGECSSPSLPAGEAISVAGFCLADNTPIVLIVRKQGPNNGVCPPTAAGNPATLGWINVLTGVYTAGNPPAGTRSCGPVTVAQTGVIVSTATSGTGSTYVPFTAGVCTSLQVTNGTGVPIELRRGGAGSTIILLSGSGYRFIGITNASDIQMRRQDLSNTIVTVSAEALTGI